MSSEPVEEGHGSFFKLEVEKTEKSDLTREQLAIARSFKPISSLSVPPQSPNKEAKGRGSEGRKRRGRGGSPLHLQK